MKIKATILGCGSSLGVPAAGNFWGQCDPNDPKNRRTRSSLLIESETTTVLVDTTTDVRIHLNDHDVKKIDGVIYSHAHADHVSGMDDLRVISYTMEKPIDCYADEATIAEITDRFDYVFDGAHNVYRPFLKAHTVDYGAFQIGDIPMTLFRQNHGVCDTTGIRIGDFAYSVDMVDVYPETLDALKGVKTWVVDAGGYHRPTDKLTTHANLERVLKWAKALKIEQVHLIVLSSVMNYKTVCEELPDHVRPAHDGLVLRFDI